MQLAVNKKKAETFRFAELASQALLLDFGERSARNFIFGFCVVLVVVLVSFYGKPIVLSIFPQSQFKH